MKTSSPRILRGMDAGSETPAQEVWEKYVGHEFGQILRNTGRIEQLEARQDDVKKKVEYILTYLQSSPWTSPKTPFSTAYLSWRGIRDTPDTIFELEEDLSLWMQTTTEEEMPKIALEQLTLQYRKSLSKISKLFSELEEDFEDIGRRIVRCTLLEEELGRIEDSLEDDEAECLCWCVSLVRDILDYNYPEDLSKSHIILFKKAIDLIYKKNINCNKQDYQDLHKAFLEAGLALLPTSRKAIEKYQ